MRKLGILLTLVLLTGALHAQSSRQIQRIYVDQLHFPNSPDWDELVRSKLISSLVQDCKSNCAVVEAIGPTGENGEDTADAVLTGAMLVQTDNRRYRVQGAMRLLDKNGTVLWAATIYSSPFARSATSSFAENTAKKVAAYLAQPKTQ